MFERERPFLPLVYICSPYSGDVESNVIATRKYARFAMENEVIPIAPHLHYPQFMNDEDSKERELAMYFNKIILMKCQELWVFGDRISKGMEIEIARAEYNYKKIRYFDENCQEVTKL